MIERSFHWLHRTICDALLAGSCSLVFANVVLRDGLGQSPAWAEEASRYAVVRLARHGGI